MQQPTEDHTKGHCVCYQLGTARGAPDEGWEGEEATILITHWLPTAHRTPAGAPDSCGRDIVVFLFLGGLASVIKLQSRGITIII